MSSTPPYCLIFKIVDLEQYSFKLVNLIICAFFFSITTVQLIYFFIVSLMFCSQSLRIQYIIYLTAKRCYSMIMLLAMVCYVYDHMTIGFWSTIGY